MPNDNTDDDNCPTGTCATPAPSENPDLGKAKRPTVPKRECSIEDLARSELSADLHTAKVNAMKALLLGEESLNTLFVAEMRALKVKREEVTKATNIHDLPKTDSRY